jgi:hypothetical protein
MPTDRRERVLTDADLEALIELVKIHNTCQMGLTSDEVSMLKRFLAAFDKAAGIVGKIVLTAVVVSALAIFTKGFWVSLATGIKQGVK